MRGSGGAYPNVRGRAVMVALALLALLFVPGLAVLCVNLFLLAALTAAQVVGNVLGWIAGEE